MHPLSNSPDWQSRDDQGKAGCVLRHKGVAIEGDPLGAHKRVFHRSWRCLEIDRLWKKSFSAERLPMDGGIAPFAIPIGIALDALISDEQVSADICQKEFLPSLTRKKRERKILAYLGLNVALALLHLGIGSALVGKKQTLLSERLRKISSLRLRAKGEFASREKMEEKLFGWQKYLQKQKGAFPLISTAPKVSDVLAWLSVHPALVDPKGGAKEGYRDQIGSLLFDQVSKNWRGIFPLPSASQVRIYRCYPEAC